MEPGAAGSGSKNVNLVAMPPTYTVILKPSRNIYALADLFYERNCFLTDLLEEFLDVAVADDVMEPGLDPVARPVRSSPLFILPSQLTSSIIPYYHQLTIYLLHLSPEKCTNIVIFH